MTTTAISESFKSFTSQSESTIDNLVIYLQERIQIEATYAGEMDKSSRKIMKELCLFAYLALPAIRLVLTRHGDNLEDYRPCWDRAIINSNWFWMIY